jgi:diadenosine tetraphosphatase ApaH/serine/threonine PP2A family protein phosphatase
VSARLAAFGGAYGNPRATAAVIADARARGVDAVWCLGDLGGFGPDPAGAIAVVRDAAVPAIRGNYDESIAAGADDCACGYADARDVEYARIAYDFTRARVAIRDRAWLGALPPHARFDLGGRRALLCHGSPRRVNEFLWESTAPDGFLAPLCAEAGTDLLLCAHTGIHWHRALPGGAHVVNVGAVGRPPHDGDPRAVWAEIEVSSDEVAVRFHRVAYDHEVVARETLVAGLPPEFAETLRTGWWTTCLENLPAPERRRGPH